MNRDRWYASDDGTTLAELMVTMAILSIFLAVFTGAFIHLRTVVDSTETMSQRRSEISSALQKLGGQIRYAWGIDAPATVDGEPRVSLVTARTGTAVCTQLRFAAATAGRSGRLEMRTWKQGNPGSMTSWSIIASGVSPAAGFLVTPASGARNYAQLQVALVARASAQDRAPESVSATFAALNNTPAGDMSARTCTEEGKAP